MSTQAITEQVRWQDLKVRSEFDIVLEIARKEGWKDCEVFGYGDMITGPQESMGWDLIPADLYEHSIPSEAVARLHQIINAGIRVQGVIIADDQRKEGPAPIPTLAPAKPRFSLPSVKPILSWIGNALLGFSLGLIRSVWAVASLSGKALLALIRVAGVIVLVAFAAYSLIQNLWLLYPLGFLILIGVCTSISPSTSPGIGTSRRLKYDPKLVALVDDGSGRTVWVSLFTWYD